MDAIDRELVNALQEGIEVCERPYRAIAGELGIGEDEVVERIGKLIEQRVLSRFGPMYDADRMGGAFTLAALSVPPGDFERVAGLVNARAEVAHNYERDHELNMWFVAAAERPEQIRALIAGIERDTGYRVLDLPKLDEYYVGLRLKA
jgi:DNA-binding Lrp family transcriptional regulator